MSSPKERDEMNISGSPPSWTSSNRCARAGSHLHLVFGGLVALLFVFGLTESRVLGFIGLSRLLVTYIQLTMAILPIFVLITTVRSVAGDREAGVFEYLLSLPVSARRLVLGQDPRPLPGDLPAGVRRHGGRGAVGAGARHRGALGHVRLLHRCCSPSMGWCFLGIGMLISALARSTDVAQGMAFMVWLLLLLFLDLILLGVMIQGQVAPEVAVGIALANPLQVFRTAALALFDPQLIVLGPRPTSSSTPSARPATSFFALAYPAGSRRPVRRRRLPVLPRGDLP
jgi:ABC-2 type transport system permease protein